jgi:DNA-3-methyladenine glycosylase II
MTRATFELHPKPPLRLDLTVWALRRRTRNGVDTWDGQYHRTLLVHGEPIAIDVAQTGSREDPALLVTATAATMLDSPRLTAVRQAVERMLGVEIDLDPFYALADGDDDLRPLKDRFLGVKPPRFPTIFEALANAIANQQLSLEVGIELLNRLTAAYGTPAPADERWPNAFPDSRVIATTPANDLRRIGFSTSKARYLVSLAELVSAGSLDEEELTSMSRHDATRCLEGLHGIGRWSAEYVLLRGLGRLEVFPADDVGARNKLQRLLGLSEPPKFNQILATVAPWQPYGGVVYFHLLLDGLAEKGVLVP